MTIKLRQSTASQEIPLGYFLDSADGNTEETGLTIANTDIKLWKTGATSLASKNSGGATHIASGVYYCTLDATDTDTLGALIIFVHVAGALPVRVECEVLPANVYDALIAGSDKLQVDTVEVSGTLQTARDLGGNLDTTVSSRLAGNTTGTGLTAIPWNAAWDAEVQSEVQDAIEANHLDHLLAADYDPASKPGTATALLNELVESDAGVSRFTANALEQAPAGGGGGTGATAQEVWEYATRSLTDKAGFSLSAAGVQAIWDALTTALTTVGSIGKRLVDNIDAAISSRSTLTDAEVWGYALRGLSEEVTVGTNNDKTGYSLAASQFKVKKNTALNNFMFLMVQSADHVTPATGLTVTAQRSIDGGLFAACSNSVGAVGDGVYKINLAASDLNGDVITLKFTATGADQRTITILTQD
jgi:hypothetical protein